MSDAGSPMLSRLRFALGALSQHVRGTVLADGTLLARFGLTSTRPIPLTDNLSVPLDELFAAFGRAASGAATTLSIRGDDGPLEGKVCIEEDGAAVVEISGHRTRFAYAALLAPDRQRQLEFLATMLAAYTLTQARIAEVRSIVTRAPFTGDDFLSAVELINSAPEAFGRELTEHLKKRNVGEAQLLPEDPRHWENLTAAHERSQTLVQFIEDELAAERAARVAADLPRGFSTMALTFGAPELVPKDWLRGLDVEAVVRGVGALIDAEDHFSLVGAFEICADALARDARFGALGEQLLDRLFGDTDTLLDRCRTFGAGFVLASAHLALHATTRDRPVYWRRLAAVAHAGLIVRTCASFAVKPEEFLRWALRARRLEYLLSVHLDMAAEPQWRPEWLDPGILAADLFGRIQGAVLLLPADLVPLSWRDRLEKAKEWIQERRLLPISQFAAVMQGSRRQLYPVLGDEAQQRVTEQIQHLQDEPTAENLTALMPWIETLAPSQTPSAGVHKVLEAIRQGAERGEDEVVESALSLAAHLAVLNGDVPLANAVAETCLERLRTMTERVSVIDVAARLVECAAADADRARAKQVLVQRLDRMSFFLPTGAPAGELAAVLQVLQSLDRELAIQLGRAVQAARLAAAAAASADRT